MLAGFPRPLSLFCRVGQKFRPAQSNMPTPPYFFTGFCGHACLPSLVRTCVSPTILYEVHFESEKQMSIGESVKKRLLLAHLFLGRDFLIFNLKPSTIQKETRGIIK